MYNQAGLKEIVDEAIINLSYNTEAEKLIDPVKYMLSMGGKRIRPLLSLLSCNLFSDRIEDAIMPAVGLEVFHNFTLVHDDIIDQAPVRRNLPTVHNRWNLNQAVLSGDVMVFIANECFLQAPPVFMAEVFAIFNKAAIEVCVGQQMDIDFEKSKSVSHGEYLRMIELKTAALMAAAAKIGAVIGGADKKDSELLYGFGRNLGLAFQIQDDLLDVYGDANLFGKIRGGDIIANKKTWLLVKAFEIASGDRLKQLQELFSGTDIPPERKVEKVVSLYDQLNLKALTEELAAGHINLALGQLDKVSGSKERKDELAVLATSLIGRDK
jgi:geranylgeranyl diphosphate synthase, type II